MASLPSIFVSHGGPTMAVVDSPARQFLQTLQENHAPPKAILMISAHWESASPATSNPAELETIHDYYGFPQELYRFQYPAHGDPALAQRVATLITENGLGDTSQTSRGLDHGAWLPLMLAYPDADIPVTQLSLQAGSGPDWHFKLGAALRPLRDEGVLILSSGALTHNLREIDRNAPPGAETPWAMDFQSWVTERALAGNAQDLIQYRALAPNAARNHPTEEHIMPLFVAMGAATPGAAGRHLHRSVNFGVLAMDAYAWD